MRYYAMLAVWMLVWLPSDGSEVDLGPWSVDAQGALSSDEQQVKAYVLRDERQTLLTSEPMNNQVHRLRYELKDEQHQLQRLLHYHASSNALVIVDTFTAPENQEVTFAQLVGTPSRSFNSVEMVRGSHVDSSTRDRNKSTEGLRLQQGGNRNFTLQWVFGSQSNNLHREVRWQSGGFEVQWQKPKGRSSITVVTLLAGTSGRWSQMLGLVRGHRLPDGLGLPDEILAQLDNFPLVFPANSAEPGEATAAAEAWHAPLPHAWPPAGEQDQLLFSNGGTVYGVTEPGQRLPLRLRKGAEAQAVSLDGLRGLLTLGQGRVLGRLSDGSQRIYWVPKEAVMRINTEQGQVNWQIFASKAGTVWRRAADDLDLVSLDGKVLSLADGRVLAVRPPEEQLRLASPWGVLDVGWNSIMHLQRRDDHGRYWHCQLRDGSRLPAFVGAEEWLFTDTLVDQQLRVMSDAVLNYRSDGGSELLQLAAGASLPASLRRDGVPVPDDDEAMLDEIDRSLVSGADQGSEGKAEESTTGEQSQPAPKTFSALLAAFAQESGLNLELAADSAFYGGLTPEFTISGFDTRSRLESILRQTGFTAVIHKDGSIQVHDPQRLDPARAVQGDGDTITVGEDWLLKGTLEDLQMLSGDGQVIQPAGLISLNREDEALFMRHRNHPPQGVELLGRQVHLRHQGGLLIFPEGHLSGIVPVTGGQP